MKNPVLQAMLQAKKLKAWIAEHGFPEIPISYLFVNTNETPTLKTVPYNEQMTRKVSNIEYLMVKIDQIANHFTDERVDAKQLRKLRRLLLEKHTPEDRDILQEFNLSPIDIITGVQCPKCEAIPMIYKHEKWICTKCGAKSKTAHIAAINDYFLIIKPTIKSEELRKFLNIDSPRIAHKLLTSMNLPFAGKFKDRVYYQENPPP